MWCYQCKELKQVNEQTPFRQIASSIQDENSWVDTPLPHSWKDCCILIIWPILIFRDIKLEKFDLWVKIIIWIIANAVQPRWGNWGWEMLNNFPKISRWAEAAFQWSGAGYLSKAWALNHHTPLPAFLLPQPVLNFLVIHKHAVLIPAFVWLGVCSSLLHLATSLSRMVKESALDSSD